jgi:hypothetical protein
MCSTFIQWERVVLGGLVVIMLAIVLEVRGFKLGRRQWIFKGDTNPEHDFLGRGS